MNIALVLIGLSGRPISYLLDKINICNWNKNKYVMETNGNQSIFMEYVPKHTSHVMVISWGNNQWIVMVLLEKKPLQCSLCDGTSFFPPNTVMVKYNRCYFTNTWSCSQRIIYTVICLYFRWASCVTQQAWETLILIALIVTGRKMLCWCGVRTSALF